MKTMGDKQYNAGSYLRLSPMQELHSHSLIWRKLLPAVVSVKQGRKGKVNSSSTVFFALMYWLYSSYHCHTSTFI
jgi:hypothetical protein